MKLKRKKLEIKYCWSPDIDGHNPWCWEPFDNDVFYLLEMNIGLNNEDYSDIYSVIIATPEGVSSLKRREIVTDKIYKIILLDEYKWGKVLFILNSIISSIDVIICNDIPRELNKYFY